MATAAVATSSREVSRTIGGAARWGGAAGIAFALSVAALNIASGAAGIEPAADAGAVTILEHAVDHETAIKFGFAWTSINAAIVAFFMAAIYQRVRLAEPVFALTGLLAGALMVALFPLSNVPLIAIVVGADSLAGEPALVEALWHLQLGIFAFVNVLAGVALIGLSVAAARANLVPGWWAVVGPAGGIIIAAAGAPASLMVEGSNVVLFGILGFVAWLVFVLHSGVQLWRGR